MKRSITRRTVDLSGYPDLVVIYLGVRERDQGHQDADRIRAEDLKVSRRPARWFVGSVPSAQWLLPEAPCFPRADD